MPLLRRLASQSFSELDAIDSSPTWVSDSDLQKDRFVRSSLIGQCANPGCRSGWLHLFRKRSTPIFEGGWTCSPECTEARVQGALRRELDGHGMANDTHHHRIPLGLLMLEQGWITRRQLRE